MSKEINKNRILKILATTGACAVVSLVGARTPKHFDLGRTHKLDRLSAQMKDFLKFGSASAGGISVPSILNNVRYGVGLVTGYSDHAAYVSLVCQGVDPGTGQSCDGPPEAGIVGTITSLVNELPTIASGAGISSCEAVPSSGSISGVDGAGNPITLNFATPTHVIPAAWVGGTAAFQHRVTFKSSISNIGPTAVNLGIAFEFNCGDDSSSYTAISMDVDASMPGYYRDITIYNGMADSSRKAIDVYMAEHDTSHMRTVEAYRIYFNQTTHAFNLWGVDGSNFSINSGNTDIAGLARIIAAGDYSTGAAKLYDRVIFYRKANGDSIGIIPASVSAVSWIAAHDTPADPADHDMATDVSTSGSITGLAAGAETDSEHMGCVNFSGGTSVAPADSSCSGFTLAAEDSGPSVDATGHFSIGWALTTLSSKLEHASY